MKKNVFLILSLIFISGLVFSREQNLIPRIANAGSDTVYYCGKPVVVFPYIEIQNITIDNPDDGIKISIANYNEGGDTLYYAGSKFSAKWDNDYGNLELTGEGSAEEYIEEVRNVFFDYLNHSAENEVKSFSVSLIDADYLPYTGHFYKYFRSHGITWTDANERASKMEYFGLQGYLATITSEIENDFIWSKIDGVGWIGANDVAKEGDWRWVTGPEKGTAFWSGGPAEEGGRPVEGRYSFWNRGEPNNNLGREHYAHMNMNPATLPKSWNDLPDVGGTGYYYPQGFIVEFGGMEGDPEVQLSAPGFIKKGQKPLLQLDQSDLLVCGEQEQQISLKYDQDVDVVIHALDAGTVVLEDSTLTPTLRAGKFGEYDFEVEVFGQCKYTDLITVKFQHQPEASFYIDEEKCKGYTIDLDFTGSTLEPATFYWYSNDTVYASGKDMTSVEIPLGFGQRDRKVGLLIDENGCFDDSYEFVTVTPAMDFWVEENASGCPPLNVRFGNNDVEDIESYFWDFGDGSTSEEKAPSHIYENNTLSDTTFHVWMKVVSDEGCENSGPLPEVITVHPIPAADLDFEEDVCYPASGEINYVGSAGERDRFLWDLTDFEDSEIIHDPGLTAGPLGINIWSKPIVKVGVQAVTEFGCKSDKIVKSYTRKPVFYLAPDTIAGCPPVETRLAISTEDLVDQVDYKWDAGNGQTGTGDSIFAEYTTDGKYYDMTISAHSSVTGCSDTLFLPGKVHVYPVPIAAFVPDPEVAYITDPVIRFNNISKGAGSFKWDFGDQSAVSFDESPEHRYPGMGVYDVSLLTWNDFGCYDSTRRQVKVSIEKIYPPTAFSPNAFKEEDREFRLFAPGIEDKGYRLIIFNRWGEKIFESQSPLNGWDGKLQNGQNAAAGVYPWVLEYYDFLGEVHKQQGTVTLFY
jgi:PKD repeat protein